VNPRPRNRLEMKMGAAFVATRRGGLGCATGDPKRHEMCFKVRASGATHRPLDGT
jgi:hypothetical protein